MKRQTSQIPQKPHSKDIELVLKVDDKLNVVISQSGTPTNYFVRIVMPDTQKSSVKAYNVGRAVGTGNSIASSTITFTEDHGFINGESVRLISDNA